MHQIKLGWAMDMRMESALVCQGLTITLLHRTYPSKVVVHSDRGSQYFSDDYQAILTAYGLTCSISHKGIMWWLKAFSIHEKQNRFTDTN